MTVFDYQQIFHVGMLVPDVDEAMRELGGTLGLQWARVQHTDRRSVWTPERGLEEVSLTFVYSKQGPQHIELLTGSPGSIWDGSTPSGAQHVGVWSDDVGADAASFVASGWQLLAAATAPEDGFGSFVYLAPPSGLIVELVSATAKPRFATWFAGGSLGNDRDRIEEGTR